MKEVISDLRTHTMMIDGKEVGRVKYIVHEDSYYNSVENLWACMSNKEAREWAEKTLAAM